MSDELVIVHPSFHDDYESVKEHCARVKRHRAAQRAKNRREERRLYGYEYDSDSYDSYDSEGSCFDQNLDDDLETAIRPCSVPLIFPAPAESRTSRPPVAGDEESRLPNKFVGGTSSAREISEAVSKVLRWCVKKDATSGAHAKTSAGKKRSRAAAAGGAGGADPSGLPPPNVMHVGLEYGSPHVRYPWRVISNVKAKDEKERWCYDNIRGENRHSYHGYGAGSFNHSGFKLHQVMAVFDLGDVGAEAKAALQRVHRLLPEGAVKHPSAERDEASLLELHKAQYADDCARDRSARILDELNFSSTTVYEEIKGIHGFRAPAGPSKWKLLHPLVRLAVRIKTWVPYSRDALLEIKVYVNDPEYKKPADQALVERYWEGARSETCRSFVTHDPLSHFQNCGKDVFSYNHWGIHQISEKEISGSCMYETVSTMFWGPEMKAKQDLWTRAEHASASTHAIPDFMQKLELPELSAAKQPTGLAVDLRDYQLQSLQRMMELEAAPGGLRHAMWVQLPTLTSGGKSVWFSPVFRIIASNAKVPALPKGGFLCEEMGLGKTVEVLALVLANPAPKDFVAKGDAKGSVMSSPSEGFTDGTELPNSADRERVKYRSKATLVVCAVSLVGQWIDEARSKLSKGADGKEQLSIHMYHGQKRIRDAKLLAEEFDLIVTTYQTLASDRGKLGVNHPLSQIEFYRIVLDEAHMAKSGSTAQSKACFELRSARRWACTGTPMGTDVGDLHGQLRFLGMYPAFGRQIFDNWFRTPLARGARNRAVRSPTLAIATMLAITVRHTKNQVINGRKILELPPKHEEKIEVELSAAERAKYRELHAEAKRTFEQTYAARGEAYLSSKILSIMALLLPLRRLCSGGYLTAADLAGADGRRVVVGGGGGARVGAEVGAGNGPLGVGVKADPNAGPKADPGANCDAPAPPALEGDAKPVLPVADAEASDKACGICHELCDAPPSHRMQPLLLLGVSEGDGVQRRRHRRGRSRRRTRSRTRTSPGGRTRTRHRRDEMRLSAARVPRDHRLRVHLGWWCRSGRWWSRGWWSRRRSR